MTMYRFSWARFVVACSLLSFAGCEPATTFAGEAKFPAGPRGCFFKCSANQMDMASFVYVGEYSTACACAPRRTGGTSSVSVDYSSIVAAAAGAELQRRRELAQAAAATGGATQPLYIPH